MGNALIRRLLAKNDVRILIQGLDASGKTTALYNLKLGEIVTTIPTIGFNVETVCHRGVNITAWDVGGRDKIRPLYRHYYQNTQGFVYVFDCNDKERLDDAIEELCRPLSEDELRDIPVLVLANKQDLPGTISPDTLEQKLKEQAKGCLAGRAWSVFGVSAAKADSGLYLAFDWLTSAIVDRQAEHVIQDWTGNLVKSDKTGSPDTEKTVDKDSWPLSFVKKMFWRFT